MRCPACGGIDGDHVEGCGEDKIPVTILDMVHVMLGPESKDRAINGQEIVDCGFAITGGCEICHASIAVYNAYPSHTGYWRCSDCIGDTGWSDVASALEDILGWTDERKEKHMFDGQDEKAQEDAREMEAEMRRGSRDELTEE